MMSPEAGNDGDEFMERWLVGIIALIVLAVLAGVAYLVWQYPTEALIVVAAVFTGTVLPYMIGTLIDWGWGR